jgi:hypothetical protein
MNYYDYLTVGKWKGITNWHCTLCPYATVEGISKALDHVGGRHREQLKQVEPIEIVIDGLAFGQDEEE